MKALIITLCVLAVFITGTILFFLLGLPKIVFNFIFSRPKRSTKIPKFYIDTPHYKVSQAGLKIMKSLKQEDVYITSRDNLKLHGYVFPFDGEDGKGDVKERKKFIIGVHGYRSYSRPEYAPYIEFYRSLGFSMLLPDDRAHAPSEGKYIGFGVLDRLDCVDWAKYLVKTYGEDVEIYLHGVSMGGATVLSASGENDLPKQVKGIVADCAFSDGFKVLAHQLEQNHVKDGEKMMAKVDKILEKKAGYSLKSVTALSQVKKATVPILFVQGGKDELVPPSMVDDLYGACNSEKDILKVPEAGHGESIAFAPELYHEKIRNLFKI